MVLPFFDSANLARLRKVKSRRKSVDSESGCCGKIGLGRISGMATRKAKQHVQLSLTCEEVQALLEYFDIVLALNPEHLLAKHVRPKVIDAWQRAMREGIRRLHAADRKAALVERIGVALRGGRQ